MTDENADRAWRDGIPEALKEFEGDPETWIVLPDDRAVIFSDRRRALGFMRAILEKAGCTTEEQQLDLIADGWALVEMTDPRGLVTMGRDLFSALENDPDPMPPVRPEDRDGSAGR